MKREKDPRDPSPARSAAFSILTDVARKRAAPSALLHEGPSRALSPADTDLLTELVYGVLRWQSLLDHIIEFHARRPSSNIDRPLLIALRIGLYQIRFLSRVPERAAVDEAVKLAHAFGSGGGSKLANAVLRSICRGRDKPQLPRKQDDALRYLAVTLSHPPWLAQRYLSRLGLDRAEALCLRNNRRPPTDLRVEPAFDLETAQVALGQEGITTSRFPIAPRCLRVSSGKATASKLYSTGAVFIQEAGSQLIPYLLGAELGAHTLDACAAPGAKATEVAPWVRPGLLFAVDQRPTRLRLLTSLARRLGSPNLVPIVADSRSLPFHNFFERILLDAPCSSVGTLARNPDIKWRLQETDLRSHAATQGQLLDSCAAQLGPGGRIVYATCSTEPEENEEVIESFLSRHAGFIAAEPPATLPREARHLIGPDQALRTEPGRDNVDGYYAIALTKTA